MPSGTVLKDGPFTDLTVAVTLISFLADCSWKRNVALTGFDDLDSFADHLSNKAKHALCAVRFLADAKSNLR
jgi:hypothetical protein